MQRLACPHCGFRNLPSRNFCSRCELAVHESGPATFSAEPRPAAAAQDPRPAEDATQILRWAQQQAEQPKPQGDDTALPFTARPTAPWPHDQPLPKTSEVTQAHIPSTATEPQLRIPTAPMRPVAPPEPAAQPLRPTPTPKAHEGVTVAVHASSLAQRAPKTRTVQPVELRRGAAQSAVSAVRGTRPQSAPVRDTVAQQRLLTRPSGRRVALALLLDTALVITLLALFSAVQMLLSAHAAWPVDRPTAFESLAVWLHDARSAARLAALLTATLSLGYCAFAAKLGGSLGQRLAGLRLVDASGNVPGWDAALWHALGAMMGVAAGGAGYIWPLLDRRKRSWASLVSRTELVVHP